nr:FAD-dependent oxidoreductase [Alloyangia pacifica]
MFSDTPDYDTTKQIASFEHDMVKQPAGLLLHPMQPDPFIEPINRAISDGTQVVTFAADSPKSNRSASITSDNLAEAKFAAEEIVKQIGETGSAGGAVAAILEAKSDVLVMHADITPATLEHIKAGKIHMALSPNQGIQGFMGFMATFMAAHSEVFDPFNDHRTSGYNPVQIPLIDGILQPDGGEILWEGEPVRIASPSAAQQLGIGLAHQEIALCPDISVAENMFMAVTNQSRRFLMDAASLKQKARAVLGPAERHRPGCDRSGPADIASAAGRDRQDADARLQGPDPRRADRRTDRPRGTGPLWDHAKNVGAGQGVIRGSILLTAVSIDHRMNNKRDAGGKALSAVVETLDVTVVPLTGGVQDKVYTDVNHLVARMAERLGGKPILIHTPLFAENRAQRDMLTGMAPIKRVFDLARTANVAFTGIGSVEPRGSSCYDLNPVPEADRKMLVGMGIAAEFMAHLIGINGQVADYERNQRLVALHPHDTAPAYGQGLAEEIVGKALVGRRDKVVLATKRRLLGGQRSPLEDDPRRPALSRERRIRAGEGVTRGARRAANEDRPDALRSCDPRAWRPAPAPGPQRQGNRPELVGLLPDAWISYHERLGLELVDDTARMAPESPALTYEELARDGDRFRLTDLETGEGLPIAARLLVNAAGAWLDEVRWDDDARSGAPMVSGTQRSHVILDNPALRAALGGHMIYFENFDGRVCIIFPYLGKVLAGSTDIRVEIPTRTASTEPERRYMLEAVGRLFPGLPFAEEDTVFSYSGIRPLPQSNHAFTGRISRRHYPTGSTARCRRSAWSGARGRPSRPLPSRRPTSCSPNSDACVRRALGPCRSAVGAIFPEAPHFGQR